MIPGFEKIVEQRIREAQEKGCFDDLPGVGQPISFEDEPLISEDLRIAYKVLKNAGFLPPELELRKEIRQMETLLSSVQEVKQRYHLQKKLNFLLFKLDAMRGDRISGFAIHENYQDKWIDSVQIKHQ
ncbi:MAG: DUF1992 domain-containing protein [Desulfobacterales bacterium]|nr:DUF1992 domain-containing protein [Desulfobacterales bacterium]